MWYMCAHCGLVVNLYTMIVVHVYNDVHSAIFITCLFIYTPDISSISCCIKLRCWLITPLGHQWTSKFECNAQLCWTRLYGADHSNVCCNQMLVWRRTGNNLNWATKIGRLQQDKVKQSNSTAPALIKSKHIGSDVGNTTPGNHRQPSKVNVSTVGILSTTLACSIYVSKDGETAGFSWCLVLNYRNCRLSMDFSRLSDAPSVPLSSRRSGVDGWVMAPLDEDV